jgi:hypothetical protein
MKIKIAIYKKSRPKNERLIVTFTFALIYFFSLAFSSALAPIRSHLNIGANLNLISALLLL